MRIIYFLDPIEVVDTGDISDAEIDEEIKGMIKDRMREEILEVVKSTAKDYETQCSTATAEETTVVCALCNVKFLLTHLTP